MGLVNVAHDNDDVINLYYNLMIYGESFIIFVLFKLFIIQNYDDIHENNIIIMKNKKYNIKKCVGRLNLENYSKFHFYISILYFF